MLSQQTQKWKKFTFYSLASCNQKLHNISTSKIERKVVFVELTAKRGNFYKNRYQEINHFKIEKFRRCHLFKFLWPSKDLEKFLPLCKKISCSGKSALKCDATSSALDKLSGSWIGPTSKDDNMKGFFVYFYQYCKISMNLATNSLGERTIIIMQHTNTLTSFPKCRVAKSLH